MLRVSIWWGILVVVVLQGLFVVHKSLNFQQELDAARNEKMLLAGEIQQLRAAHNELVSKISTAGLLQGVSTLPIASAIQPEQQEQEQEQTILPPIEQGPITLEDELKEPESENVAQGYPYQGQRKAFVRTPTYYLSPLNRTTKNQCDPQLCHSQCNSRCNQLPHLLSECRHEECNEPQVAYKADLEYPIFFIGMPHFIHQELRDLFLSVEQIADIYQKEHGKCPSDWALANETRCSLAGEWNNTERLLFTHKRYVVGQLVGIKNGFWNGKPHSEFFEGSCDQWASYKWLIPESPRAPAEIFDKVLVFMTPATGGAYFQHFIDRGFSALMQVWPLLMADPSIKILVPDVFKAHKNVELLWKRFGITEDRLLWRSPWGGTQSIGARHLMIFPCVAPHYHPYPYQKSQELLGINLTVPLHQRNKLVYLTRRSVGRRVDNEDLVLDAIKQFLQQNNRPEELVVYEAGDYPEIEDNIRFFNYHARALIGPHGGAFYNQIFCAPGTLVIEFFPIGDLKNYNGHYSAVRWPEAVWWPAEFLGFQYYMIPSLTSAGDVTIPPHYVTDILRTELIK